jgi:hypothetical protein
MAAAAAELTYQPEEKNSQAESERLASMLDRVEADYKMFEEVSLLI